jgi:hypothetical protein
VPGDGGDATGPVDGGRLRNWTERLATLAGLPRPARGDGDDAATLGAAVVAVVEDLGWAARANELLAGEDLDGLLRDPETVALAGGERRALACLAAVEALRPFPDGRFRPELPPTGARLAGALVRIGESYRAFGLKDAVVAGVESGHVRLVRGKGTIRLSLAAEPVLFGLAGGRATVQELLELWPGDRVRYRTDDSGRIDFLELRPPVKGTSDDRSAKLYSWEVRRTRRQLEAAANRRVAIGRLEDLEIVRRGVSGRVVELRAVGTRASADVRGFDVRRLLDLPDSLLVIEIQRDDGGDIEAVVFAGKGWGHGVGLCQVGAYGMALRGADYREILGHYYTGAKIERPSAPRP